MGRLAKHRKLKKFDLYKSARKGPTPPSQREEEQLPRSLRNLMRAQREHNGGGSTTRTDSDGGAGKARGGKGGKGDKDNGKGGKGGKDDAYSRENLFYAAFKAATKRKQKTKAYFDKKKAEKAAEAQARAEKDAQVAEKASARRNKYRKAEEKALEQAEAEAASVLRGTNEADLQLSAREEAEVAELEELNEARRQLVHGPDKDFDDFVDDVAFGEHAQTVPKLNIPTKWKTRVSEARESEDSAVHRNVAIVNSALGAASEERMTQRQARKRRRAAEALRIATHNETQAARAAMESEESARAAKRAKRERSRAAKKAAKASRKVAPEHVRSQVQAQYRMMRQLQAQRRALGQ
ncbi:uncharacterized protein AMSG_06427 [Thecamonas trahens ATCC 50062]|uniref:Uncharacterized protein n=1 Tax=Thecamonas trahens ATCC 50062 TaxID=461836 RepID=A0A0L0DG01_THETB|nr:hypothetical protein AMSG_06427 [Thecamonas trahens ATCC 50062]KNC50268.1 hypothetical protein AMSG_06427 [Thecamonas trahens ATCC 50062]|eukprot:XP_013757095.1 hypothetical protein AMSG_06427 [Thecamonas trahens ATCC 50062]